MIWVLELEYSHNKQLQFGKDSIFNVIVHAIIAYHFIWRIWNQVLQGFSF